MKPQFIAALAFAAATFAAPTLSASAQTQPTSMVQQFEVDAGAALAGSGSLDLSLRSHDDWALPVLPAPSLDLSPRSHDDWAVSAS